MKLPQFYTGNLVSQLCLCMQLRAFGLPVSFSLPPSNDKAPLPKFRSITGERGDHTWADFTGCFYGGKNKQKSPESWKRRKKGTEFYPASAQWRKVPGWAQKMGTPESISTGKALFSSQDASSVLILQSYLCNSVLPSQWKSFACHKCNNQPMAVSKAFLPSDRLGHHCIQNFFQ